MNAREINAVVDKAFQVLDEDTIWNTLQHTDPEDVTCGVGTLIKLIREKEAGNGNK